MFAYLKERIWSRIQGWKEKMLSQAGKEILIKAVAQAIPTFAMGCFDITKEICDQISTLICRFWWSDHDNDKKVHWICWEKLTEPKGEGGLGFRDIYSFNLAMLAKQSWRFVQNPDSLCSRVLGAKYFPSGDILTAGSCRNMSYTWRSILKDLEVLKREVIWRVGDGRRIRIWEDPWIPREWTRSTITPRMCNILVHVDELIDPYTGQWDEQLVRQTFWPQDVGQILSIPIHVDMDDVIAWHYDTRGIFSVRSAYKVQRAHEKRISKRGTSSSSSGTELDNSMWKKLWKLNCPGKMKHHLWRMAHNSLAIMKELVRRGMVLDTKCVLCNRYDEDGAHLFFKCKCARYVWAALGLDNHRSILSEKMSPLDVVKYILILKEEVQIIIVSFLWLWWQERNRVRQGDQRRSVDEISFLCQHILISARQILYTKCGRKLAGNDLTRNGLRSIQMVHSHKIQVKEDGA